MQHLPCTTREELCRIFGMVIHHWPFDAENYPALGEHASDAAHRLFAVGHIERHIRTLSTGLLEEVELAEHGAPFDDEKIAHAAVHLMICGMRLVERAGVPFDRFLDEFERWLAENFQRRKRLQREGPTL